MIRPHDRGNVTSWVIHLGVGLVLGLVGIGRADASDLSISYSTFDPVSVGGSLNYVVGVINNGPGSVTGVTVTDTLPPAVTFSSVGGNGWSCTHSAGVVSCARASLGVGAAPQFVITVVVPAVTGPITNTASVTANEADPVPGNNSVTGTNNVVDAARLINISTRAFVGTGPDVLVGGFIIGGTGTKQVLVRGFGPTLTDFGLTGVLNDPILELRWDDDSNPNTPAILLLSNDSWTAPLSSCPPPIVACGTPQDIASTGMSADSYAPGNATRSLDAAVLLTLPTGTFTATLRGVSNTTGIGLIGIDDVDSSMTARVVNISTRAFVGTGTNAAVGGFILSGLVPRQLLLRGFGPTLADFGVPSPLANPTLSLWWDDDNNATTPAVLLTTNDNWSTGVASCPYPLLACGAWQEIVSTGLSTESYAPTNPNRLLDSALLVTLPPFTFTGTLRGAIGGTGVGLIGVDDIGPCVTGCYPAPLP